MGFGFIILYWFLIAKRLFNIHLICFIFFTCIYFYQYLLYVWLFSLAQFVSDLYILVFNDFRISQILCTIPAWDLITSNSNNSNNIIIDVKHLVPHIISHTICLGNCNSQLIRRTCTWPVRDILGHSHTRTRGLILVKIKVV